MSAAKFVADLSKWKKWLDGRLDEAVRNIGFAVAEEVVVGKQYSPGSPVDTGFFRANWIVGIDSLPVTTPLTRPTGAKPGQFSPSLDAVSVVLAKVKAGSRVFIINPVVYGLVLEKGHSQQAPRGMVRITVAAGQHIVDDTVKEMVA